MKLYLPRIIYTEESTIGHLFIGMERFCYTLEDCVRPAGVKVYGKTAIPAGTYSVQVTWSPRFNKMLPEILDVPMFTGIRIHGGNTADHSLGCILVGYELIDNNLIRKSAADDLTKILLDNQEDHFIEIVDNQKPLE
jgi:hypothetical protein